MGKELNKFVFNSKKHRFQYLKFIGQINNYKPFPKEGPNYVVQYSELFKKWDPKQQSKLFQEADHHRVRATQETIDISINKMDVPRKAPDPNEDPIYKLSIKLVITYLSYAKSKASLTREFELNGAASPGLPYPGTKSDALQTDLFYQLFKSIDHVPVDEVNAKQEELSMEDHNRKKTRTVFCAPLDFVVKEKVLFDEMNEKIKKNNEHSFIKYGMVKQYGGFDRLCKRLRRFQLMFDSDCSGWDRIIPLDDVYLVREALLTNKMEFDSLFQYVKFFNVHPVILLPDGTIWQRDTGNDSGKNNTTTDNSIMHLIIMFYFFLTRASEIGKPMNLQTIIDYCELAIYSDDKTGSCDHDFWQFDIESFMEHERMVYARFGLTIKPSQQVVTLRPAGSEIDPRHSFLGSYMYFDTEELMYVPFPRLGKLCSSLINEVPKLNTELLFRRYLVLTTLLYPKKELFQEAISLTSLFMELHPEENTKFMCILEEQNLTLENEMDFKRLYLGYEARDCPWFSFLPVEDNSITNETWKFDGYQDVPQQWTNFTNTHREQSSQPPLGSCPQGGPRWVA